MSVFQCVQTDRRFQDTSNVRNDKTKIKLSSLMLSMLSALNVQSSGKFSPESRDVHTMDVDFASQLKTIQDYNRLAEMVKKFNKALSIISRDTTKLSSFVTEIQKSDALIKMMEDTNAKYDEKRKKDKNEVDGGEASKTISIANDMQMFMDSCSDTRKEFEKFTADNGTAFTPLEFVEQMAPWKKQKAVLFFA